MQQVKNADTVKVHYHGRLADGTTFDSSEGREPLEFKVGAGQVIPGFDQALIDMKPGEKKTINIPVDQAYGQYREDMIFEYPRTDFPADMSPAPGLELQMSDQAGNIFPVVITEVTQEFVMLDANHPLAGKDLIFDIELVEIL
jgi:FKBP-type peptidyl-prolyl cis-trans isomerase 2